MTTSHVGPQSIERADVVWQPSPPAPVPSTPLNTIAMSGLVFAATPSSPTILDSDSFVVAGATALLSAGINHAVDLPLFTHQVPLQMTQYTPTGPANNAALMEDQSRFMLSPNWSPCPSDSTLFSPWVEENSQVLVVPCNNESQQSPSERHSGRSMRANIYDSPFTANNTTNTGIDTGTAVVSAAVEATTTTVVLDTNATICASMTMAAGGKAATSISTTARDHVVPSSPAASENEREERWHQEGPYHNIPIAETSGGGSERVTLMSLAVEGTGTGNVLTSSRSSNFDDLFA